MTLDTIAACMSCYLKRRGLTFSDCYQVAGRDSPLHIHDSMCQFSSRSPWIRISRASDLHYKW